MFQLILPFQLELPFDARPVDARPLEPSGGAAAGRPAAPVSSAATMIASPRKRSKAAPLHAPVRSRKRAEPARSPDSLELPIDLLDVPVAIGEHT